MQDIFPLPADVWEGREAQGTSVSTNPLRLAQGYADNTATFTPAYADGHPAYGLTSPGPNSQHVTVYFESGLLYLQYRLWNGTRYDYYYHLHPAMGLGNTGGSVPTPYGAYQLITDTQRQVGAICAVGRANGLPWLAFTTGRQTQTLYNVGASNASVSNELTQGALTLVRALSQGGERWTAASPITTLARGPFAGVVHMENVWGCLYTAFSDHLIYWTRTTDPGSTSTGGPGTPTSAWSAPVSTGLNGVVFSLCLTVHGLLLALVWLNNALKWENAGTGSGTFYAGPGGIEVIRSTDRGATWSVLTTTTNFFGGAVVTPANMAIVSYENGLVQIVGGGLGAYTSHDGGLTWA